MASIPVSFLLQHIPFNIQCMGLNESIWETSNTSALHSRGDSSSARMLLHRNGLGPNSP